MTADIFIVKLSENSKHSLEFFNVQFQTDNPGKKNGILSSCCNKHIQEGLVFLILARSKRAADPSCVLWWQPLRTYSGDFSEGPGACSAIRTRHSSASLCQGAHTPKTESSRCSLWDVSHRWMLIAARFYAPTL